MMWLGEPDAGIPYLEKAIRLNPHDPTLASHYATLGLCHLFLGHVDQAIDLMRKARAENPRSSALGSPRENTECRPASNWFSRGMTLARAIKPIASAFRSRRGGRRGGRLR